MRSDPIIEELHRFRQKYAERFNFDIHAIVKDLQQQQNATMRLATLNAETDEDTTELRVAESERRWAQYQEIKPPYDTCNNKNANATTHKSKPNP